MRPRRCRAGRAVRALTEEEVIQYLDALELRERLMARLEIFEGLRPGKVLALRWGSFDGEAMKIRERVYEGKIDTPKSGRRASRRFQMAPFGPPVLARAG